MRGNEIILGASSPVHIAKADRLLAADHPTRTDDLISRFERIPFSGWHRRARITMGTATFLDAFDALSLAFVLPVLVKLWSLTPADIGWLIAASYIGQLVGALLFSRLAEAYGRVPSAAAATAIMSVMSLGCVFAGSFPLLFVCRLIQGIGVGGEMPVAAAYISELSRAEGRGRFFMLYEMIFPVGLMVTGQVGTILVPMFGWQSLFLIGGIPGLILAFILFRLPESPRWLIAKGRLEEADAAISNAERSAVKTYPDFKPQAPYTPVVPESSALKDTPNPSERGRWMELLSPVFRARTVIAWALWACAFFVANSLNNWMPTLYHTVYNLDLATSLRAASMTNVAQVIILLVCAFCIDRIGRRNWAVASFVIGALLLAALAFGAKDNLVMVIVLATLAYGIVGSVNAVLYLYTPEIYPTRMRALGTGIATSWLRLASAVGPALVGYMVSREGIGAVFVMFAIVAAIGALAASQMIETRGRKLEDIAS
ncbi:MFS transporter [Phyllobacterium sp. SB3]|uniref:MFS transporter n=1 Tax=Phyllobacterium sp. SB3 TaxID=3156073 RepID=UPI0032AF7763